MPVIRPKGFPHASRGHRGQRQSAASGTCQKLVVNAYMSILIEGVAETMELADRLDIGHQQS